MPASAPTHGGPPGPAGAVASGRRGTLGLVAAVLLIAFNLRIAVTALMDAEALTVDGRPNYVTDEAFKAANDVLSDARRYLPELLNRQIAGLISDPEEPF